MVFRTLKINLVAEHDARFFRECFAEFIKLRTECVICGKIIFIAAVNHEEQACRTRNMLEEADAKPRTFRSALYDAGNIGYDDVRVFVNMEHAEIRNLRGERIRCNLRTGVGEQVEQA